MRKVDNCSRSRSQQHFKMLMNVCPDGTTWTSEHFVTKLGMVMQHHEPECHTEKLVHCLQCEGHSESLFKKVLNPPGISTLSCKLLVSFYYILLTADSLANLVWLYINISDVSYEKNLVWWYIIVNLSIVQKDWFAIFRVKVTARARKIKIWQFLQYLLNCWSFCHQTWFDGTLFNLL